MSKRVFLELPRKKGLVEVKVHNLRNWSKGNHRQVDDRPYGGGAGMVLMVEPIFDALKELKTNANTKVIMTSPSGAKLTQSMLHEFSGDKSEEKEDKHFIILCGHYEGFDERIREHLIDYDISIGEYVLSGGELPALIIMDGITRLVPGVLGNAHSAETESFEDGKMDFPVWTRPEVFNGWNVPKILLQGHHKNIENYRSEKAPKLK